MSPWNKIFSSVYLPSIPYSFTYIKSTNINKLNRLSNHFPLNLRFLRQYFGKKQKFWQWLIQSVIVTSTVQYYKLIKLTKKASAHTRKTDSNWHVNKHSYNLTALTQTHTHVKWRKEGCLLADSTSISSNICRHQLCKRMELVQSIL